MKTAEPAKQTIMVVISNTDNKLTQSRWVAFIKAVKSILLQHNGPTEGLISECYTEPTSIKQTAILVANVYVHSIFFLKQDLTIVRGGYAQDSVAVLTGDTEFI